MSLTVSVAMVTVPPACKPQGVSGVVCAATLGLLVVQANSCPVEPAETFRT